MCVLCIHICVYTRLSGFFLYGPTFVFLTPNIQTATFMGSMRRGWSPASPHESFKLLGL